MKPSLQFNTAIYAAVLGSFESNDPNDEKFYCERAAKGAWRAVTAAWDTMPEGIRHEFEQGDLDYEFEQDSIIEREVREKKTG